MVYGSRDGICSFSSGAYDAGTLNATWSFAERADRAPLFRLSLANTVTEVPLNLGYGIEAKIQVLVVALQQAVKK